MLPVNNNIHRYSASAIQRNCVFCVNAIEKEEHLLFACLLYTNIREKLLNDASQNVVTASLEKCSFLGNQNKYGSFGQVCFECD